MPIEQHSPGLERLVDVRQEIEELARGFGGAEWTCRRPRVVAGRRLSPVQ